METRSKIKKVLHLPLIMLAQVLSLWVNEAQRCSFCTAVLSEWLSVIQTKDITLTKKKFKKLLDCYCSIFPFLLSWGCININEMLKEKKKEKKESEIIKKKGFPKQIITIQSLFREKLWLCYIWIFPIYFALAKLCANDGSPYVYMNAHCQTEKLS